MTINNVMCVISIMALNRANEVVLTVVTISVALVVIGSILAPIAQDVMDDFTATDTSGNPIYENGASWASLVGVVVLMSVLALVLVAINGYTKNR